MFLKISAESKRRIFVTEAQKNLFFSYSPDLSTKSSLRKKEITVCFALQREAIQTEKTASLPVLAKL